MARKKKKAGKEWTRDEVKKLKKLFRNSSTADVAKELGRSTSSVQSKATQLGLKKTKKYLKSIGRA